MTVRFYAYTLALAALLVGCGSTTPSRGGRTAGGARSAGSLSASGRAVDPTEEGVLDFGLLTGFEYREPEPPQSLAATDVEATPPLPDSIPAKVRALDGDRVRLRGFVVPLDLEEGQVTTFLLLADHRLCCAGQFPRINDIVEVRCSEPVQFVREERVEVEGKFEVGEVFEYGYLASLYRLNADRYAVIGGGPPPLDRP